MTHFKNMTVITAAVAAVALGSFAYAEGELDDLLGDVVGDAPKAEAPAEPAPAPAAEVAAPAPAVAEEAPVAAPAEGEGKVEAAIIKRDDITDDQLLAEAREVAELRADAWANQAKREIADARFAWEREEYAEAAEHWEKALKYMIDSPAQRNLRKECMQGITDAKYRAGLQEWRLGNREKARGLMEEARERRHPKATKQLEIWAAETDPNENRTDVSDISHRRNDDDYKQAREKMQRRLRRSRQLLAVRDLDGALDEVELVLVDDPYNQQALRLREQIEEKRQTILDQEFEQMRKGMIADVRKAWRPVYAPNIRDVEENAALTIRTQLGDDPERKLEQTIIARMKEMKLPSISFKPPATIIEAVETFRTLSKDFDRPDLPVEERGFNFVLKTPEKLTTKAAAESAEDTNSFSATNEGEEEKSTAVAGVPVIPMIQASNITFFDALKLVCDAVGYKFKVQGQIVMVMDKNTVVEEMVTRSYPVVPTFMDRVSQVRDDMKTMGGGQFGQQSNNNDNNDAAADANGEDDVAKCKKFFELMGVQWPEGSAVVYIKTIGKLRVRNTYDNLAELEKALTELNVDTKLIEIEARFVEVCQEDLNSLGFEWILNSDYNLNSGNLGKWLGVSRAGFQNTTSGGTTTTESTTTTENVGGVLTTKTVTSTSNSGGTTSSQFVKNSSADRNIGINAFGGTSTYQNGNRYLSTEGNHVSGAGESTNDQFMRFNAFLGNADLSMILHMLSQRSDTDLLSAPKVLTSPSKQAVIKVVTEYIYPTEYNVQLQSSSSGSSGSSSGSSQSAILAVVEPENFTMREVGVILDVTPELAEDGNLIMLHLDTQVVDEPTWEEYGMELPFTGNTSLESFAGIGEIFTSLATLITQVGGTISQTTRDMIVESATESAIDAMNSLTTSSSTSTYKASMRQPFFHTRSIVSDVSVYPGSTIVMGGLIREERKAMDDKIPFLGDLPFVGRLFRSHAEKTTKRNLLIFITTRLVDARGREVSMSTADKTEAEVKAAPEPEAK